MVKAWRRQPKIEFSAYTLIENLSVMPVSLNHIGCHIFVIDALLLPRIREFAVYFAILPDKPLPTNISIKAGML